MRRRKVVVSACAGRLAAYAFKRGCEALPRSPSIDEQERALGHAPICSVLSNGKEPHLTPRKPGEQWSENIPPQRESIRFSLRSDWYWDDWGMMDNKRCRGQKPRYKEARRNQRAKRRFLAALAHQEQAAQEFRNKILSDLFKIEVMLGK